VKEQVTQSQSGRGMGVQVSRAMQEVRRPLLTPDECLRMPGPQKNERDLMTFAARAKIPPPKHSDALGAVPVPDVQIS
jgi:hypothetical protein